MAFKVAGKEYPDLSGYCQIETIDRPNPVHSLFRTLTYTIKNMLSPRNICSRDPQFLNYYYSPKMDKRIKVLLTTTQFDVVAVDHFPMLSYLANEKVPTVLLETHAVSEILRTYYRLERNCFMKVIYLLQYWQARNYAEKYRAANISIAVSAHQRDMVKSHCSDLDIQVIPYGVDTDYLRPIDKEEEFPTLIIFGGMDRPMNVKGVLWFYSTVYPLIKVRVPQVKLYIVGSNPKREILHLADKSVIVTGYVEDFRPYLSSAWVVVAPLQDNFGVKVRVLQAMAVGKPVVSTSMVTSGIDVSPGENIVVSDEPAEFAERVIDLLNDKQLREEIGTRARLLMETSHSWESLTGVLNEVLEKAARSKLLAQDRVVD